MWCSIPPRPTPALSIGSRSPAAQASPAFATRPRRTAGYPAGGCSTSSRRWPSTPSVWSSMTCCACSSRSQPGGGPCQLHLGSELLQLCLVVGFRLLSWLVFRVWSLAARSLFSLSSSSLCVFSTSLRTFFFLQGLCRQRVALVQGLVQPRKLAVRGLQLQARTFQLVIFVSSRRNGFCWRMSLRRFADNLSFFCLGASPDREHVTPRQKIRITRCQSAASYLFAETPPLHRPLAPVWARCAQKPTPSLLAPVQGPWFLQQATEIQNCVLINAVSMQFF